MSILDYDNVFYDLERDKKIVEEWIKNNYNIYGDLTISDDLVVDCTGSVIVKNRNIESLATDMFRWGNIRGDFTCSFTQITSLEGAPEKVGGSFYCQECINLKSLEGAPEVVGGRFVYSNCPNLKITDSDRKKHRIKE